MSFFMYDMAFLAAFCIILFVFLYTKRKNLKREGIMYLYRTKIGLKIIDYIGKKYPRGLNILGYFIIAFGYAAMIAMLYLLYTTVKIFFQYPDFIRAVKIPPLAPLIPYLPQIFNADYLPMFYFTYWIIVIAIVGIVHEFSHGIFARLYKIRVKSTGFAFLGPFIGAFVEPDEKHMKKAKKREQLTILAAGTFSNAVLCVLFLIIFYLFFSLAFSASGVIFNTYTYDYINKSSIDSMGNNISVNFNGGLNLTEIKSGNKTYFIVTENVNKLSNISDSQKFLVYLDSPALEAGLNGAISGIDNKKIRTEKELAKELESYKPGDNVTITTTDLKNYSERNYQITLGENPGNETKAYIGVATLQTPATSLIGKVRAILIFFKDPNVYYAPKFSSDLAYFIYYLIWWIIFINFSVALVNMLPAWIFDGGRFFYLTIQSITKSENIAKIAYKIATYIVLGVFLLLMILWAFAFF